MSGFTLLILYGAFISVEYLYEKTMIALILTWVPRLGTKGNHTYPSFYISIGCTYFILCIKDLMYNVSYYRLYLHNRLTYRSIGYFYKSKTKTSVCLMSTLATLSVSWLRFVSNLSKVIGSRLALLELVFTGIVVVVGSM